MDAVELSKLKAGKRSIVNSITKTLRILQLCVALFFLTWFFTRLPLALRLSADYLRSPLFVFAVFNAIIAALLAQSRRFTQSNSDDPVAEAEHRQIATDWRSVSEEEEGEDGNKTAGRELRRSETEKGLEKWYPQDKLTNEEFRRTIEAFIAKQMRLLREE
ncbi:hypothetical protein PHAVU_002G033700 [Phaseolus vulgaris]|uniref:DUF4408 domain-containing protein n=1 Tax=Phaseolus vulgaris TaxID=3885 RepID=V7CJ85_PHAVU|nr:hypothetical protein PHAVU_002G033700g [Phaseolus vulgaris]ESW28976.1 hypothetical protein PHAVU_002G033700g [Phaseolus vulgaris]